MLILNDLATYWYNFFYLKLHHDCPEFLSQDLPIYHSRKNSKIAYIYIKLYIVLLIFLNYGTLILQQFDHCPNFENLWEILQSENNLNAYESPNGWYKYVYYTVNFMYFIYILTFWMPFLFLPILKNCFKDDESDQAQD